MVTTTSLPMRGGMYCLRLRIQSIGAALGAFLVVAICLVIGSNIVHGDENWLRFRGPNGTGVSNLQGLPTEWKESDYEWSVTLDGKGHSSPVVYNDYLFVTSGFEDGRRSVICLDALTGKQRWSDTITLDPNRLHKKNSYCSSSPATDGERVYVAEADASHVIVNAYTLNGEKVWTRDLGEYVSSHGFGPSPILHKGLVILPRDQDGSGSVVALDAKTGKTKWTSDRSGTVAAYSTPMVIELNGQEQLVVINGATGLAGIDLSTGRQLWESGKLPERPVASPVFGNGLLLATCGSGGRGKYMVAVDPLDHKEEKASVKIERKKLLPYVPTPVIKDQYVYFWNDDGTVCCLDMKGDFTDEVWRQRVGGNYSGSPVLVDGKIYCISESGEVKVVDASPTFRQYDGGNLGDNSHCTPAIANGRMYLKGFHKLVCLKAKSPVAKSF